MLLKKAALAPATAWPKHRLELAQLVSFKKSTSCLKFGWVFKFAMNWIGDWNSPSCWRLVTYWVILYFQTWWSCHAHYHCPSATLSTETIDVFTWNKRTLSSVRWVMRRQGVASSDGSFCSCMAALEWMRQRWSMNEALLRKERPQKRTQQIRRTTTIIAWKSQGYASDMVNKLQYLMHIRHTTKFKDRTASPLICSTTLRRSRSCRYHHRHMNLRRNKMKQACLEWYKHPKNHKDEYLSSTYSLLTIQMGVHASIFHRKCAHQVDQSHDTQLQLHLGRHGDQQHHQWEPNGSHHQIQIDSDVFTSTWKSTGDRFQLSYLCHQTWIPSGVFVVGPSALMVTFPWPLQSSTQLLPGQAPVFGTWKRCQ